MKRWNTVTGVLRISATLGLISSLAAGCTLEQASEEAEAGSLSQGAALDCTIAPPHFKRTSPACPIGFDRTSSSSGNYTNQLCPKRLIVEYKWANGQYIYATPSLAEPLPTTKAECESLFILMEVYQQIDPPGSPPAYWYKHDNIYRAWGLWANGRCTTTSNHSGIKVNEGNPYLGTYRLVGSATYGNINRPMSFSVWNQECD
jgi:hypothetical protein